MESPRPRRTSRNRWLRFNGRFVQAWEEAVDYVGHFDDGTLRSAEEFFRSVYRPRRDELAAKWTEMSAGNPKR